MNLMLPKWTPRTWNIYTNWSQLSNQVEISTFPRNVYTSDGNLILRTTKEPYEAVWTR